MKAIVINALVTSVIANIVLAAVLLNKEEPDYKLLHELMEIPGVFELWEQNAIRKEAAIRPFRSNADWEQADWNDWN
jgi:hypothetical protein